MGEYEDLEHLLTAVSSAKERAELPPEVWTAKLREYRSIKNKEIKMATITKADVRKAQASMVKIKKQRDVLEEQYIGVYEGLKELEETSARRILEGENLAKETKRVAAKKAERDALAAAIRLAETREQKAAEILYEKQRAQATLAAKKLILATFAKMDRLDKIIAKPPPEYEELNDMYEELNRLVAPFSKTDGIMFAAESRIIGAAMKALQPLEDNWKVLTMMRENYAKGYTDERLKL